VVRGGSIALVSERLLTEAPVPRIVEYAAVSKADEELGHIAVRRRLVTADEVEACLSAQAEAAAAGQEKSLGDLLVERRHLTPSQLDRLLSDEVTLAAEVGRLPGYKILGKLGQGAMGTVFKARQLSVDRLVAIKVLFPRLSKKTEFVTRMMREARAAASLNHPNIIQAIDAAQAGRYYYFVMEYVEGKSVQAYLADGKVFQERASLDIAIQVAKGLKHAHDRGLIHRDVKPGNILLTPNGTAKLADLGLVYYAAGEETASTAYGTTLGTPHYISPEQVRGQHEIDGRSDVYSLGATLFHMVTGRPAFQGRPVVVMHRHLNAKLPAPDLINTSLSNGICEVIECMMAKKPDDRYANADDLLIDLQRVAEGRTPPLAHKKYDERTLAHLAEEEIPTANVEKAPSSGRGYRIATVLLAVALVASLAVIGLLLAAR